MRCFSKKIPRLAAICAVFAPIAGHGTQLAWDPIVLPDPITVGTPVYKVTLIEKSTGNVQHIDAGPATTVNITDRVVSGQQYEAFVNAACDGCDRQTQESIDSNHLVFTAQPDPITIVSVPTPIQINIEFKQ